MPNAFSGEKRRLFADDTNLFITSKTVADSDTSTSTKQNKLNSLLIVNKLLLSI